MSDDAELLIERSGGAVVVTLNRPAALNAIAMGMYRGLSDGLEAWLDDPSVRVVVVRGAGDRAFSAGGDIRMLYEARRRGDQAFLADVFKLEYALDRFIHRYPKPYVPLMDGLVMGGGCGLSVHGSHRVVTERTALAMPETAIGFFPDVGASYFLSRCPGAVGIYLGLTGAQIGAADALYAGLADRYVPSDRLADLTAAMADGMAADAAVDTFAADPGPPPLAGHQEVIDRCFFRDTPEAVMDALEAEGGDFARQAREILGTRPRFSLQVTLEAIRRGADLSVEECLVMEYRVSQRFMHRDAFFEGVRAAVIDKDGRPAWDPHEPADAGEVAACFAPLDDELTFD